MIMKLNILILVIQYLFLLGSNKIWPNNCDHIHLKNISCWSFTIRHKIRIIFMHLVNYQMCNSNI